ncbi:MAG TPA: TolC family protein [Steroidobacteraceae bacterium]|jgi:outer membrane protein|nr:TolC family protein [Steroidobacteraceae bacterium]
MTRRWLFAILCAGAMSSAAAADLLAVYQRALDTDPLWQQATATRLAIHETKTQAVLGLLPLDISANKNFVGIGSVQIKTPAYLAAGLSVNLFNWDNWVALKAADATVAQSEANYQAAAQSLIQRVSQQFFAVLAAQDTLTAEQSAYESVQTQLDQAEQRYKVGLIAVTDVAVARASRDSTAAAVIAAKRALATQEDLLRAITNENYASLAGPRDDMPLLNPDPASEDNWVTTAMAQNANLIASRMASDIAHDNLLTAYGGHLPTININVSRNWALEHGNYGNQETPIGQAALIGSINGLPTVVDTNDVFWSIGISVPLFTAGLTQSKVRQARYNWDAAKAGLDFSSRQTEEQTRDAYQGVISQIAQVRALKQAVESDRIALQATEAGYQVGTKTVVDVLTTRAALLQDDTNYALAKYGYLNGIVSLRLAAGNLNRSTIELINGWLIEPRPPLPAVPGTPNAPATTPVMPLDAAPIDPAPLSSAPH